MGLYITGKGDEHRGVIDRVPGQSVAGEDIGMFAAIGENGTQHRFQSRLLGEHRRPVTVDWLRRAERLGQAAPDLTSVVVGTGVEPPEAFADQFPDATSVPAETIAAASPRAPTTRRPYANTVNRELTARRPARATTPGHSVRQSASGGIPASRSDMKRRDRTTTTEPGRPTPRNGGAFVPCRVPACPVRRRSLGSKAAPSAEARSAEWLNALPRHTMNSVPVEATPSRAAHCPIARHRHLPSGQISVRRPVPGRRWSFLTSASFILALARARVDTGRFSLSGGRRWRSGCRWLACWCRPRPRLDSLRRRTVPDESIEAVVVEWPVYGDDAWYLLVELQGTEIDGETLVVLQFSGEIVCGPEDRPISPDQLEPGTEVSVPARRGRHTAATIRRRHARLAAPNRSAPKPCAPHVPRAPRSSPRHSLGTGRSGTRPGSTATTSPCRSFRDVLGRHVSDLGGRWDTGERRAARG